MPRSNGGGGSHLLAATLGGIASKEESFRKNVDEAQRFAHLFSQSLCSAEEALLKVAKEGGPIITEAEVTEFIEEQRARLLKIAEKNVENNRNITSFVAAAKQLGQQQQEEAQAWALQQQGGGSEDGEAARAGTYNDKDYESLLRDLMAKDRRDRAPTQIDMGQEAYVREIRKELRLPEDGAKNDEDEDVVIANDSLATQTQQLKCPLTGKKESAFEPFCALSANATRQSFLRTFVVYFLNKPSQNCCFCDRCFFKY